MSFQAATAEPQREGQVVFWPRSLASHDRQEICGSGKVSAICSTTTGNFTQYDVKGSWVKPELEYCSACSVLLPLKTQEEQVI